MPYALITGASSGIGAEFARTYAQHGYSLVLVARSADKMQALATELMAKYAVQAQVFAYDLSKPESPKAVYEFTQQAGIQVDVLVNNAGFADYGEFYQADWQKNAEMIDLNVKTLTHLTHLYLPGMVARKTGRILNVASTAAFQPGPLMSVYYATKAYVLFFSEAIANELKGTGVTVTALCPGITESGFQAKAAMQASKLVKGKKMPTSAEVAAFGYQAAEKGQVVAVHGALNYMQSLLPRIFPRNLITQVVRMAQDRTH